MLQGHEGVMKMLLLAANNDVSPKSSTGRTPLHYASEAGHVATATLLLELNADVSAKSNEGASPLHVAAWQGREEVNPKPLTPTLNPYPQP